MLWKGRRESENVEDRRGMPAKGIMVGGGIGSVLIILLIALLGGDIGALFQGDDQRPQLNPQEEQELEHFVKVVLADTEDVWQDLFRRMNRTYRNPKLVLYSGQVDSACGFATAAVGPFYCPEDEKLYIDLSFFQELRTKYGAKGDFAIAYVVAHEVAHHVQKQLGYTDRVHGEKGRVNEREYNRLSQRLELQADFLAGVWAHHAQKKKKILEPGDIQEAMGAASAVGDDRLQKQARGYVVPDSFTHGRSDQRVRWFRRGFDTGDPAVMKELFDLPFDRL